MTELTPQLARLLAQVHQWDADRQFAEYDQPPPEAWDELTAGAYALLASMARVVEDRHPEIGDVPWRDIELL